MSFALQRHLNPKKLTRYVATLFSGTPLYFFFSIATIEMMQEPEICLQAGMQPDEMVDELGAVLAKYEVPMGLMNKRMF